MNEFHKKGFGIFCGKFSTFPVSKLSSIIIKNKDDLMLADLLMQGIDQEARKYKVKYDDLV